MNQKSRKARSVIVASLLQLADDSRVQAEIPDIGWHGKNLSRALREKKPSSLESALLTLYERLHRAGSVYSPCEREILAEKKGYACYPGGLSPLLRAVEFIKPESIVADLGAGNGLQGLLLQRLSPHQKTVQIEISSEMIRVGQIFQRALGICDDRIDWIHDDIMNSSIETADFIYIYLPAKPLEGGKELYEAIAQKLITMKNPPVIFSVADCLARFLDSRFSIFYSDGHLTCFVKK